MLEDSGDQTRLVSDLVKKMKVRGDKTLTSTMTIGEIMVKPIDDGDLGLIVKYRDLFSDPELEVLVFGAEAAWEYAKIRQDRSIKAPDAIQLACAAAANCDMFITNDHRLSKKVIPGIQFIVSLDRVPI